MNNPTHPCLALTAPRPYVLDNHTPRFSKNPYHHFYNVIHHHHRGRILSSYWGLNWSSFWGFKDSKNREAQRDCSRISSPCAKASIHGRPPKSQVRGLHLRRLKPDQEMALHDYLKKLDELGIPARLHMVEQTANINFRRGCDPENPPPPVALHRAKWWLERQPDLFKVKRKPLPVARKNAHDLDVLTTHSRRNFWVITQ